MYHIQIKPTSSMGNGVFATKTFAPGETIEICPVIPIPEKFIKSDKDNEVLNFLEYWFYEWGSDKKGDAMVLGYGMVYNHSDTPNANYQLNLKSNTVTISAGQVINNGSEIFINYRIPGQNKLEMLHPKTHEETLDLNLN